MKRNKYKCLKCETVIETVNRDTGNSPHLIGCIKTDCDGMMESELHNCDQESTMDPELIFIRPKNDNEWKVVKEKLKDEIRMKYPKKKPRKVDKMADNLMFRIVDHVKRGGLVQMMPEIVEALESY